MKFSRTIIFISIFVFCVVNAQKFDRTFKDFNHFRLEGNFTKAQKIIVDLEKKITNDNPELLPYLYAEKTKYYFSKDQFVEAKYSARKSYQLGQKSSIPEMKAYGLFAQAYYYYQLNLPETSVHYAKGSAAIIDKSANPPLVLSGQLYYLLYRINTTWDDFKYADYYAQKCIEVGKKLNDYELLTNAYSAKSTSMEFGYQKTKNEAYKDSIKYYLEKSLVFYEEHPKDVSQRTYAISNINLANVYLNEYLNNGSETF